MLRNKTEKSLKLNRVFFGDTLYHLWRVEKPLAATLPEWDVIGKILGDAGGCEKYIRQLRRLSPFRPLVHMLRHVVDRNHMGLA